MLTPSQAVQPSSVPLVSMIVICYNQARFVVETLESVKAQSYKNTELIIVDDCSTDDSVAVIERWLRENGIQCTFIRHEKNQGVCKALNDALAVASGVPAVVITVFVACAFGTLWFAFPLARRR